VTRPLIGVMCGNEHAGRPVQVVADRFLTPLTAQADVDALLVPAKRGAADPARLAGLLDGLLLTGSRTHVAPWRYGATAALSADALDEERDAVALALANRVIEAGKPVLGICRGFQELNVLFGGALAPVAASARHHRGSSADDHAALFRHRHEVTLRARGLLAGASGVERATVTSVHQQGMARLGAGLAIEALTEDGLVEAFHARPGTSDILAVQ